MPLRYPRSLQGTRMYFLHSGGFQNMVAKSQTPKQVDEVVIDAVTFVGQSFTHLSLNLPVCKMWAIRFW